MRVHYILYKQHHAYHWKSWLKSQRGEDSTVYLMSVVPGSLFISSHVCWGAFPHHFAVSRTMQAMSTLLSNLRRADTSGSRLYLMISNHSWIITLLVDVQIFQAGIVFTPRESRLLDSKPWWEATMCCAHSHARCLVQALLRIEIRILKKTILCKR